MPLVLEAAQNEFRKLQLPMRQHDFAWDQPVPRAAAQRTERGVMRIELHIDRLVLDGTGIVPRARRPCPRRRPNRR